MFFGSSAKKILLVDDEAATRSMLGMLFSDAGFEILEAGAGDQGVQEAIENLPDVIILDINLPNMSGFECLQVLRQNEKTKAIPIIMCTAHDTLDDVERCINGGAQDYIQKPFDLQTVLGKVKRQLEGK
jgi:DNA-binding response OmpR family regulator